MESAGGTPPQPLRLKDLLELDCDSCSAAGFRCYPRRLGESAPAMRRLLDSPPSLRLHQPSKLSSLSRTLSRRLGSFWRRRDEDGEDDAAAATPRGSVGSESSGASSSSPTTSGDSSRRRGSRCESGSDFSTATSSAASDSVDAATVMPIGDGDEHEAVKRRSSSGSEADDKEAEQLSPVSVMDFPFDDDEGEDAGACSPSPSFSLARLQRRKMLRTQNKNRRFRSTEEVGPVNLEALLAATSDAADVPDEQRVTQCSAEDEARPMSKSHRGAAGVRHDEPDDEHGILALLMDAGVDHVSKRLLLDFFVEMKRRRGSMEHRGERLLLPREAERLGDDGGYVLAAARGWLDGTGSERRWGLDDVLRGGRAVVAEMERDRRWMQVGEEEREVGAVVAGMLADQLVDEVLWNLLV